MRGVPWPCHGFGPCKILISPGPLELRAPSRPPKPRGGHWNARGVLGRRDRQLRAQLRASSSSHRQMAWDDLPLLGPWPRCESLVTTRECWVTDRGAIQKHESQQAWSMPGQPVWSRDHSEASGDRQGRYASTWESAALEIARVASPHAGAASVVASVSTLERRVTDRGAIQILGSRLPWSVQGQPV